MMVFQVKSQNKSEPDMLDDEIYLIAQYRNLSPQDRNVLQCFLRGDAAAALPFAIWALLSQQLDQAKQVT